MTDGNIYGMNYFSTPVTASAGGSTTPGVSSAPGTYQPSFQAGTAPLVGAQAGTKPWTTGQKIGAGLAGAGALYGLTHAGGGGGINPDPYGMGAKMGAEATQLWDLYNKGEINPADQARIGQWEQQQKQSVRDYYQKAGLGDSSMAKEAEAQVGTHAQNMRQQANQNLLQPALQATGLANRYGQELLQYQMQQDQAHQQAQQNFMQTVGMFAAMAL